MSKNIKSTTRHLKFKYEFKYSLKINYSLIGIYIYTCTNKHMQTHINIHT